MDEFARIEKLFAPLTRKASGADFLRNDAACLPELEMGWSWVVTSDALVEGVHFLPETSPDLIARKALRTNLSDLAAMGSRPRAYTLSLALRSDLPEPQSWIEGFCRGLERDQEQFSVSLIGGDSVSTAGPIWLSITAFGAVETGRELKRSGAELGDSVWVSGTIGDSALGLKAYRGEIEDPSGHLKARYDLPNPRTELGPRLVGIATAALDVSDGLVQDAGHIARQSSLALELRLKDIPLSPAAHSVVEQDEAHLMRAITGGDDYELLFTAPSEADERLRSLSSELGLPLTRIGEVKQGSGVTLLDRKGQRVEGVGNTGWRHFD